MICYSIPPFSLLFKTLMSMKKTIEQSVANAILQKPIEIKIGSEMYSVPQPTIATLILVSEEIGSLPNISMNSENPILESIAKAEYYKNIGRVYATIILGAKRINETRQTGRWFFKRTEKMIDYLSRQIMEEYTPQQLNELLGKLLGGMQIAFFFAITTSLNDINNLKPTKNQTIVSGQ